MKKLKIAICASLIMFSGFFFCACEDKNKTFNIDDIDIGTTQFVYNGRSQAYNVTYNDVDVTVTYSTDGYQFKSLNSIGTKDAGNHNLYYKLSADGYKDYVSLEAVSFSVKPKDIVVTIEDMVSFKSDGAIECNPDWQVNGLVAGDGLNVNFNFGKEVVSQADYDKNNLVAGKTYKIVGIDKGNNNYNISFVDGLYYIKDYVEVVDAENQVVGYYGNLQSAVDAASEGQTVRLAKDMELTETLNINKSLTIDGCGKYSIKANKNFGETHLINVNGENKVVKLNNVKVDANNKTKAVYIQQGSVEVDNNASIVNGKVYDVEVAGQGKFVVNSGKVEFVYAFGSVEQKGGEIDAVILDSDETYTAEFTQTDGSLEILKNVINGTAQEFTLSKNLTYKGGCAILVNGEFVKDLATAISKANSELEDTILLYSDIDISNVVNINKSLTIDSVGENKQFAIKASEDFVDGQCFMLDTANVNVTFGNVKLDANNKARVIVAKQGKLTIDGAKITNGFAKNSYIGGVYVTNRANFEMVKGNISGNHCAEAYSNDKYLQYSADLWIGANAKGVVSSSMEGGEIGNVFVNANEYSATNQGDFTVEGGKITNVYVEYDDSLGAKLFFKDGEIENLIISGVNTAEGYAVSALKNEEDEYYVGGLEAVVTRGAILRGFASFDDALSEANNLDKITLCKSVTLDNFVLEHSVEIDGNGKYGLTANVINATENADLILNKCTFSCSGEINNVTVKAKVGTEQELIAAFNHTNISEVILNNDIELSAPFVLNREFVVNGNNKTIKAGESFEGTRLFEVNKDVTMKDLTINANSKARCVVAKAGTLNLNNVYVTGGKAVESYIGGIYVTSNATLSMVDCVVSGNSCGTAYSNDKYLQYSADLWIGANAKGELSCDVNNSIIGNVFVNANEYSATNAGDFTFNGGTIENLYVEYSEGYGAKLIYNGGTIYHLYIATGAEDGDHFEVTNKEKGTYTAGGVLLKAGGEVIGFATLQDLMKNKSAELKNYEIELLHNTEIGEELTILEDNNVIINGNGYTLTVSENFVGENLFNCEAGHLTINNVNIEGNEDARILYVGKGNVNIVDTTTSKGQIFVSAQEYYKTADALVVVNGGELENVYLDHDGDNYAKLNFKAGKIDNFTFVTGFGEDSLTRENFEIHAEYCSGGMRVIHANGSANDYVTFEDAYSNMQNGDKLEMRKDVVLNSTMVLNQDITFTSIEGKFGFIASNDFADRKLIDISKDINVTFEDLLVDANNKCRAVYANNGTLTVKGETKITNGYVADSYIGGVYLTGAANFVMEGGEILGNHCGEDYSNDNYLQYSADLWIGANANGSYASIIGGKIGNVFINANEYSANNPGSFTFNGGEIDNLYVEYNEGYHGSFTYTSGTLNNLYLSTTHSGLSFKANPVAGTTYGAGYTYVIKHADRTESYCEGVNSISKIEGDIVWAYVATLNELKEAFEYADQIVLLQDIEGGERIKLIADDRDYKFTLDLNAHHLANEIDLINDDLSGNNAYKGKIDVIITDRTETLESRLGADTNDYGMRLQGNEDLKLTLQFVTLKAKYGGLQSNGSCEGATVNANKCYFMAVDVDDSVGVYLAAKYVYTFEECEFDGGTAYYTKSGEHHLTRCNLNGTAISYAEPEYYGNGANPTGSAMVVDSAVGYKYPIVVNLKDCAFTAVAGYGIEEISTYPAGHEEQKVSNAVINIDTGCSYDAFAGKFKTENGKLPQE